MSSEFSVEEDVRIVQLVYEAVLRGDPAVTNDCSLLFWHTAVYQAVTHGPIDNLRSQLVTLGPLGAEHTSSCTSPEQNTLKVSPATSPTLGRDPENPSIMPACSEMAAEACTSVAECVPRQSNINVDGRTDTNASAATLTAERCGALELAGLQQEEDTGDESETATSTTALNCTRSNSWSGWACPLIVCAWNWVPFGLVHLPAVDWWMGNMPLCWIECFRMHRLIGDAEATGLVCARHELSLTHGFPLRLVDGDHSFIIHNTLSNGQSNWRCVGYRQAICMARVRSVSCQDHTIVWRHEDNPSHCAYANQLSQSQPVVATSNTHLPLKPIRQIKSEPTVVRVRARKYNTKKMKQLVIENERKLKLRAKRRKKFKKRSKVVSLMDEPDLCSSSVTVTEPNPTAIYGQPQPISTIKLSLAQIAQLLYDGCGAESIESERAPNRLPQGMHYAAFTLHCPNTYNFTDAHGQWDNRGRCSMFAMSRNESSGRFELFYPCHSDLSPIYKKKSNRTLIESQRPRTTHQLMAFRKCNLARADLVKTLYRLRAVVPGSVADKGNAPYNRLKLIEYETAGLALTIQARSIAAASTQTRAKPLGTTSTLRLSKTKPTAPKYRPLAHKTALKTKVRRKKKNRVESEQGDEDGEYMSKDLCLLFYGSPLNSRPNSPSELEKQYDQRHEDNSLNANGALHLEQFNRKLLELDLDQTRSIDDDPDDRCEWPEPIDAQTVAIDEQGGIEGGQEEHGCDQTQVAVNQTHNMQTKTGIRGRAQHSLRLAKHRLQQTPVAERRYKRLLLLNSRLAQEHIDSQIHNIEQELHIKHSQIQAAQSTSELTIASAEAACSAVQHKTHKKSRATKELPVKPSEESMQMLNAPKLPPGAVPDAVIDAHNYVLQQHLANPARHADQTYTNGQLIFAKIKGFPWWPSWVVEQVTNAQGITWYEVRFLHTDEHAQLKCTELCPYVQNRVAFGYPRTTHNREAFILAVFTAEKILVGCCDGRKYGEHGCLQYYPPPDMDQSLNCTVSNNNSCAANEQATSACTSRVPEPDTDGERESSPEW